MILVIILLSIIVIAKSSKKEIELYSGWNLIGLPCNLKNPDVVLSTQNIQENLVSIFSHDDKTKEWSSYDPINPDFSDLKILRLGEGYWIEVKENVTWRFKCVKPK